MTFHNPELDSVRLARQETIEWAGADGWAIEGVLTYPLDYVAGQRYPLVLQVHGGPEGVSLDGWTTVATYPVQILAANGYMVLEPNYRGSAGRGVAFSKADHDDLGGKEYEDVLAGIDHAVGRGSLRPDGGKLPVGRRALREQLHPLVVGALQFRLQRALLLMQVADRRLDFSKRLLAAEHDRTYHRVIAPPATGMDHVGASMPRAFRPTTAF